MMSCQTNISPEQELLLCCSRIQLDSDTINRIHVLSKQDLDWQLFVQQSVRHGAFPLVYHGLQQAKANVPPIEQLKALYQTQTQRNLGHLQELTRLLAKFEQHNLPVTPFKGPLLAMSAYESFALRKIGDLDLLVRPEDYQNVVALLKAQGYEIHHSLPWECHLTRDDRYTVDLHVDIVPDHLYKPLSRKDIWASLQTDQLAGHSFYRLPLPIELLMLCLNGTKDCWQQLSRICDIAELIKHQSIDWPTALTFYETWGFKRLVGTGLYLAQTLLDLQLPSTVSTWVQANQPSSQLLDTIHHNLFVSNTRNVPEIERSLFYLRTRERYADKMQTLLGVLDLSGWFHPTVADRNWIKLPAQLSFLYYLLRPVRILSKYQRDILRFLISPKLTSQERSS